MRHFCRCAHVVISRNARDFVYACAATICQQNFISRQKCATRIICGCAHAAMARQMFDARALPLDKQLIEPYKLSTEPYILIKVCDTYYFWVCTCSNSEKNARLVCACACVLLLLESLQFMNSQRKKNCFHNPLPRILKRHLEVHASNWMSECIPESDRENSIRFSNRS